VNNIIVRDQELLILTAGGLLLHNLTNNSATLEMGSLEFPDPDVSAAAFDKNRKLWVGSKFGYLGVWGKNKWENVSRSYQAAGWKIRDLLFYNDQLFVGASNGVSLFDINTQKVDKSTIAFGSLTSTQVNDMVVFHGNLYLGLDHGLARLDSLSFNLKRYNFFDPLIWKIDSGFTEGVHTFIIRNDSLHIFSTPAALYKDRFLTISGKKLLYDNVQLTEFPSEITCLTVVGNDCWIGTTSDYYYKWDGQNFMHYTFSGPTFQSVNALIVDKNSHLWAIPAGGMKNDIWWNGFHQYNGDRWTIHNTKSAPEMGFMPGNPESHGLGVSTDGSVWICTAGSHLKRFSPANSSWSQFCTYSQGGSNGGFFHMSDCPIEDWAKTDAIAQDSSGFMWIGCWDNPEGSLICYDPKFEPVSEKSSSPEEAHYRRFFPDGHDYNAINVSNITVDTYGNILVGNSEGPDNLMVMKHDGNPLRNGIKSVKVFDGTGTVIDAVSSPSGPTYLVTTKMGVCTFDPVTMALTTVDEIESGVTAIAMEDDDIFWFASPKEGLIRYNVQTEEKSVISQIQGLVSLNIKDLAIDNDNGFLWAATDVGVTRVSLGLRGTASKNSGVSVFPVPFRKNRHTTLNFHNVPVGSTVSIYTMYGQLIAKASVERSNSKNASHSWVVPESVVPGTYYYSVSGKDSGKSGKILVSP
jgi:ligand-binding sensor domain-containing protein